MTNKEIVELAEIISTLPNYAEEYHESKYLVVERVAQWVAKKKPKSDLKRFGQICWG